MGEVVRLHVLRVAPEARQEAAYLAFCEALTLARQSGALRDMATAVRAYEAWLELAIPDPAQRAEVWS